MLNQTQLQRIRELSIASLLGIKQYGRYNLIKCPFPHHDDSSPSFAIYDTNSYHCFGCNKHGNGAIDFLIHMGYSMGDIEEEFGSLTI